MRIPLSQVTLVAVDTQVPMLATEALLRCLAQLDVARALLFTHGWLPRTIIPGLQVVEIDRLPSPAARSEFVLRTLPAYVRTSHALFVQWDAFVAQGSAWLDEFLIHDYIGAPWPDQPEELAVGSGGFSLRSRRMLMAGQDRKLVQFHPEDEVLCRLERARLEREHGVSYAPASLARRFAVGEGAAGGGSFGFHGVQHLPRVLDEKTLQSWLGHLPDEFFRGAAARRLARAMLRHRMPTAARQLLDRRDALGDAEGDTRWLGTATSIMGLLSPRA